MSISAEVLDLGEIGLVGVDVVAVAERDAGEERACRSRRASISARDQPERPLPAEVLVDDERPSRALGGLDHGEAVGARSGRRASGRSSARRGRAPARPAGDGSRRSWRRRRSRARQRRAWRRRRCRASAPKSAAKASAFAGSRSQTATISAPSASAQPCMWLRAKKPHPISAPRKLAHAPPVCSDSLYQLPRPGNGLRRAPRRRARG